MKIMIIAGEASGDNHAAKVIEALRAKDPQVDCFGIGSTKMHEAGCRLLFDARDIAVVGLIEVLKHYGEIKAAWNIALKALDTEKPDCVLLVDYPGFNLRFAKEVKKRGIRVVYYVSPQIWAWHKKRGLKKIKASVDHMVLILPFEAPLYKEAGIPATYVGSPLLDQVEPCEKQLAREKLSLSKTALIFGILPGSRVSEFTHLLPELIDAAELLSRRYPHTQFVIPLASTIKESDIWPYLDDTELPIVMIKRNSHLAMSACDVLMGSSGTVTLEAALLGLPMVIIYKMNAFTYWLAKRLVKIKWIGLPNLLAGKKILPELIQHAANSHRIAEETERFIDDEAYADRTRQALKELTSSLGEKGAAKRVAEIVLKELICHPKSK